MVDESSYVFGRWCSDKAKMWLVNLRGRECCPLFQINLYVIFCSDSLLPFPVPSSSLLLCSIRVIQSIRNIQHVIPPLPFFTSHARHIGGTHTPPPIATTTVMTLLDLQVVRRWVLVRIYLLAGGIPAKATKHLKSHLVTRFLIGIKKRETRRSRY